MGYEGSELSVAVVESVPASPSLSTQADLWNWMKGVKVLAINHVLQRAYETTWAAFSLSPFQYHARRIVLPTQVLLDKNPTCLQTH